MIWKQCTSILSSRVRMSKHYQVCLLITKSQSLNCRKVFWCWKFISPGRIISCCAGNSSNVASSGNLNISSQSEKQLIEDMQDASSVLHMACLNSDVGMVELLLQHGADINACDSRGRTPLHYCIIRGNTKAAKALIIRYIGHFLRFPKHFQSLYYITRIHLTLIKWSNHTFMQCCQHKRNYAWIQRKRWDEAEWNRIIISSIIWIV